MKECYAISTEKGWWEHKPEGEDHINMVAAKLMLMTSELAEALEELRTQKDITKMYYTGQCEGHHLSGTYEDVKDTLRISGRNQEPKPEGFPSELADVIIRVFDLCEHLNIDIEDAIETKIRYNKSRTYKHGGKAI
ncbi:hypothetical protein LCGC14_0526240 [marine sediment metagenome]|uniref:NTP pyrophosphohydrolase MazG putative catalytic core domain-containing protein n=1 Tax=marine sediment metagenome TaxID=412755 RepID=A0A0F9S1M8_9ZZZZ